MNTILPQAGELTFTEVLLVTGLVAAMGLELYWARSRKSWLQMFRPTLVVAGILAYYALLSPLVTLWSGEVWIERGQNLRSAMVWGFGGALVFFLGVLLGFHELPTPRFDRRFILSPDPQRLYLYGRRICWLAVALYALVAGPSLIAQLNPFSARETVGVAGGGFDLGGVGNYFAYALNLLIPGVLLLFTSWMLNRRHGTELVIWTLVTSGLFLTLGFRWRLIVLAVPMLLLWYLIRRKRPSIRAMLGMGFLMIFLVSGVVGQTREYGFGLNLGALGGQNFGSILSSGFTEGRTVFLTTSGLMERIPDQAPFVGIEPIRSAILIAVPRFLMPEKDTIGYLTRSLMALYKDPALAAGAATLSYGEYFLIAGWPSLIVMSVLFGWLLRCLWNWFLQRSNEPFAQVIYILSTSFIYVVISRGYLAQVVYLAAFTLYPLYWLYGRLAQPVQRRVSISSSSSP